MGIDKDDIMDNIKNQEELKGFEDAKNAYVFAHRFGSEYIYDSNEYHTSEDQALALAALNEFNKWIMNFINLGLKAEAARVKAKGAEPPVATTEIDGTSP